MAGWAAQFGPTEKEKREKKKKASWARENQPAREKKERGEFRLGWPNWARNGPVRSGRPPFFFVTFVFLFIIFFVFFHNF